MVERKDQNNKDSGTEEIQSEKQPADLTNTEQVRSSIEAIEGQVFPAVVAKVLDGFRVVINRGSKHGIKFGQRFQVYELTGEDIIDPVTKESLGRLENAKGTGRVMQVQESMSVVKSDGAEFDTNAINVLTLFNPRNAFRPAPFDNPQEGDLVKPI